MYTCTMHLGMLCNITPLEIVKTLRLFKRIKLDGLAQQEFNAFLEILEIYIAYKKKIYIYVIITSDDII